MKEKLFILFFALCGAVNAQNSSNDSIQNLNFLKNTLGFGGGTFIKGSFSNVAYRQNLEGIYCVHLYYKRNLKLNRSLRAFLQIEKQQDNAVFAETNVVDHSESPQPNNEVLIISDISIEKPEEALYNAFSLGYEFQKHFKKWNFFYGADAFFGYFKSVKNYDAIQIWETYSVNPSNYYDRTLKDGTRGTMGGAVKIEDKSISAGIAPFVGLEYYINKHISFFSQMEIAFAAQINRTRSISKKELYYSSQANRYNENLYNQQTALPYNKDIMNVYVITPSLIGFNFHF